MFGLRKLFKKKSEAEQPWNKDNKPAPTEEILDSDEMDLTRVLECYAEHPDVSKRMLKMAHLFGLSRQQIAHPNRRAALIVKRCNHCAVSGICFKNRDGSEKDSPGFRRERCPNLETYREIAKDAEHRTPIKNKAY